MSDEYTHDVFISYARADQPWVEALAAALYEASRVQPTGPWSIVVTRDPLEMVGQWGPRVKRQVRLCGAFLPVLSLGYIEAFHIPPPTDDMPPVQRQQVNAQRLPQFEYGGALDRERAGDAGVVFQVLHQDADLTIDMVNKKWWDLRNVSAEQLAQSPMFARLVHDMSARLTYVRSAAATMVANPPTMPLPQGNLGVAPATPMAIAEPAPAAPMEPAAVPAAPATYAPNPMAQPPAVTAESAVPAAPEPAAAEAENDGGVSRPAQITLDKMTEHMKVSNRRGVRMTMLMLRQFLPTGHPELQKYEDLLVEWDAEEAAQKKEAEQKAAEKKEAEKKAAAAAAAKKTVAAAQARKTAMPGRPGGPSGRRPATAAGRPGQPGRPRPQRPRRSHDTDHELEQIVSKLNWDAATDEEDDSGEIASFDEINIDTVQTTKEELERKAKSPQKKKPPKTTAGAASKPPTTAPRAAASSLAIDLIEEGMCAVFLNRIPDDKKEDALALLCEIRGCTQEEATELAGRIVVPVVKNVTKQAAEAALSRFKRAGLAGRIKVN